MHLAENALQLPELATGQAVTLINTVPSAITELVRMGGVPSSVRRVNLAGEPLQNDLVEKIYGLGSVEKVCDLYGPSEDTTYSTFAQRAVGGAATIGRPIANTQVYLLSSESQPVPFGVAGELHLGGSGLARGYLHRPALTAESFVPDPFSSKPGGRVYRTGDLSRYLEGGNLEFLGRIDHQVKIRGFRIELGEIEASLKGHPLVREAVVLAREDDPQSATKSDKRLVAYLVAEGQPAPGTPELRTYLRAQLPAYMVPATFVMLEALPLTPNGKVDRKALPAPAQTRPASEDTFVAASTVVEQRLADIWSQVLGLDQVGLYDNFFELGGDSILSIQIVSKANQAGLRLTAKDIFQHQTVAELAGVAGVAPAIETERSVVSGPVPLTPIQNWFLDLEPENPHHFNQAILLEVPELLSPPSLERAVQALFVHHDALRARFRQEGSTWNQAIANSADGPPPVTVDLSALSESARLPAMEETINEMQGSLDLSQGPLLRVAQFKLVTDGPIRLFIVIHHLVIDGFSWRILLEDLQTAYEQSSRGENIQLPVKTTSFKHWSQRLAEYADGDDLQEELKYWLKEPGRQVFRLPADTTEGTNNVASAREVSVSLSKNETQSLLQRVPETYRTQINDVLLTALVKALAKWTGKRSWLIDLEGHGREELFEDVELSRTVGWFTTLFPVLLKIPETTQLEDELKSVKEQLRGIPNRGIGHGLLRFLTGSREDFRRLETSPNADVIFNYLGQIDQALGEDSRFKWAGESSGAAQHSNNERPHLLEVRGLIGDGCLQMSFKYSENRHQQKTIERLAHEFCLALRLLIRHCQSPGAGGYTPSDFPLARLDQDTLERVVGSDRQIADLYPLSPTQQGLLFHTLFDPGSGVYHEQLGFTAQGELNVPAFRRAWQEVIDRHTVLRTSFRFQGLKTPLQVVQKRVDLGWTQQDLRGFPPGDRQVQVESYLQADRERGFELTQAPLMRLALFHLAEKSYRFVWSHHHLLLDGWSMPLVLKEVLAYYNSFCRQETLKLDRPKPYRDYIAWHGEQDLSVAEEFWRDSLRGCTSPTPLGVDSELDGPLAEVADYGLQESQLSMSLTESLGLFTRRHQLTLNTLLQGVWALLLSRYSGEEDVLFGATVSGRSADLVGLDSMVGLFINTLPVRVRVDGNPLLLPWLQELQRQQLEARSYEYSPLGRVQGWSEMPAGTPLFESLLVIENYPVNEALQQQSAELEIRKAKTIERTNYPLTVVAAPGHQLGLRLNYDYSRFDQATIERMMGHFEELLEGMIARPEQRLDEFPLLAELERKQIQVTWNDTHMANPDDVCVHHLFEAQVAASPDSVAVVFGDQQLTYRGLNAKANRLAHHLRTLGVGPGTRVGVCMSRGPEMVASVFAVLKAGGAYVPLDPNYPKQRLEFMLEDSGATVVLTEESLETELPRTPAVVESVDAERIDGFSQSSENPVSYVTPDSLSYVIYTSGSTGLPKGAMIEHRSLLNYLSWCKHAYPIEEGCGAPVQSSIGFDATITSLFSPLLAGRRVVLLREEEEIEALGSALSSGSDFSLVKLTPAHLKMLSKMLPSDQAPGGARAFIIGGETLSVDDIDFWREHAPDTRLINEYGPTETVVGCCVYEVSKETPGTGGVPIGRPIHNTQLYVLHSSLQSAPIGVPGELHIGGLGVGRGYLNQPALTSEKFVPDPFGEVPGGRLYKTGDLVRRQSDGNLEFLGRNDHQVKIRGFRIELGEIEIALRQHDNVRDAVVLAPDDQPGGKRLVAYLTIDGESPPTISHLRSYLQQQLPAYAVPAAFVILESLPLTPNGKVDRRALSRLSGTRLELGTDFAEAGTEAEEKIAAIWREVLGVDRVGIDDNYFDAGGDSLSMIEVQWRLRDAFDQDVSLVQLFQNPTIRALAARFSRQQDDTDVHKKSLTRVEARLAAVRQRRRV